MEKRTAKIAEKYFLCLCVSVVEVYLKTTTKALRHGGKVEKGKRNERTAKDTENA